ncbi:hypothetical protein CSAL01_13113 [Colletotrichum salicis]|uniref:Uncharacterized protein n=1 Tax=Colletotrichum salicis TaxID=1209931 RepID=A0A135UTP9_9PEZI|nr:hypothetical protein CSAL01_13113 [Colletotrichum salicis]
MLHQPTRTTYSGPRRQLDRQILHPSLPHLPQVPAASRPRPQPQPRVHRGTMARSRSAVQMRRRTAILLLRHAAPGQDGSVRGARGRGGREGVDAFDILAREVPLFEVGMPANVADAAATGVGPRKMRSGSADALMALMGQLEIIVVHRNTLRMIREMALDEFPRPPPSVGTESRTREDFLANATAAAAAAAAQLGEEDSPSCARTSITGDMFQPMTPHFFQSSVPGLEAEGFDLAALGFPGDFDLLDA